MPMSEIRALAPNAEEAQVKAAKSACIAEQIRAGRTREEAQRICESMIQEQMAATPELPGGL